MTQMLADVVKDHLINLKDEGELPAEKAEIERYINHALTPGAIAYAIQEAMKTVPLAIELQPEIILTEF